MPLTLLYIYYNDGIYQSILLVLKSDCDRVVWLGRHTFRDWENTMNATNGRNGEIEE